MSSGRAVLLPIVYRQALLQLPFAERVEHRFGYFGKHVHAIGAIE